MVWLDNEFFAKAVVDYKTNKELQSDLNKG